MVTQILTQFGVPAEDLSHGERFLRGAFAGYVSTSDPDVPKNWKHTAKPSQNQWVFSFDRGFSLVARF